VIKTIFNIAAKVRAPPDPTDDAKLVRQGDGLERKKEKHHSDNCPAEDAKRKSLVHLVLPCWL
jgi:hypothetical protein